MGNPEETERMPLLPADDGAAGGRRSSMSITLICLVIFAVGCVAVTTAISLSFAESGQGSNTTTTTPQGLANEAVSISVLSLMVWGSPGSFGVDDKELRMAAIGDLIAGDTDHDVFLLNDLWMRADHATIRKLIPKEYEMTSVNALSSVACDGVAAPEFCSGLAIVSKLPLQQTHFTGFSDHGDLFWDYEYFLRRGAARVRLEPSPGYSVDIVLTSLASLDYNHWYRDSQTAQLLKLLDQSEADHLILAGDLNVDPSDHERTYNSISSTLVDSFKEFYKNDPSKFTDKNFATLGNPGNTYTEKDQSAVIYDYIFYKNKGITLTDFKVLNLKTKKEELSISDHQAVSAKFTLSKT